MDHAGECSVVIVGSGAAGLALACELAASGVACTVVERAAAGPPPSPAVLLQSRTLEELGLRGHARALIEQARPVARMRLGGRAAALDLQGSDSRFPGLYALPQSRVEEVLAHRAAALGAVIRRGLRVEALAQGADGVRLRLRRSADSGDAGQAGGAVELAAAYAVGCDTERGSLRELAGIGREVREQLAAPVLAEVRLRQPLSEDLLVRPGRGGVLVSVPAGDDWYRITLALDSHPWSEPQPTAEEFTDALRGLLGHDPGVVRVRALARPRTPQSLATHYRAGRVLLLGDAAHQHATLGGQGINLGLQDAVNLGWKLAAVVRGWCPPELLDSYEAERRPIAAKALRRSERAARHLAGASPASALLRRTVLGGLPGPSPLRHAAAAEVAGPSTRYPAGPLLDRASRLPLHAGQRLPELPVRMRQGPPMLAPDLLDDGRFLLLDFGHQGVAATAAERGWGDRVRAVSAIGPLEGYVSISTLLVRPDGYLAWADDSYDPTARIERASRALTRWCGPAASA
ncbi:hypothetical protein GXW83_16030 [Streptacidiphilus sp. PB12-B1b]|uniref:FAD-dependent monooxygenase n=1 Tax=Streptacidiphilus sp. PB12-B1b TaxID=2705012 RepID=UPI0015FA4EEB|nr:FAD-dependent monooxygenase [Streptacidiphilus sp. PB12-B1b]QMU76988.1 hypothetical protein GXW83_16030 [Streptacidiphilus sp. PB12-B1b]